MNFAPVSGTGFSPYIHPPYYFENLPTRRQPRSDLIERKPGQLRTSRTVSTLTVTTCPINRTIFGSSSRFGSFTIPRQLGRNPVLIHHPLQRAPVPQPVLLRLRRNPAQRQTRYISVASYPSRATSSPRASSACPSRRSSGILLLLVFNMQLHQHRANLGILRNSGAIGIRGSSRFKFAAYRVRYWNAAAEGSERYRAWLFRPNPAAHRCFERARLQSCRPNPPKPPGL